MHALQMNFKKPALYNIIHESKAGVFVESMLECYESYSVTVPAPTLTSFYNTENAYFADYFSDALLLGRNSWGYEEYGVRELTEEEWEDIDTMVSDGIQEFEVDVFSDLCTVLDDHNFFYIVCQEDWDTKTNLSSLQTMRICNSPIQEVW